MKKHTPWFLSLVSCLLVVICLFQIIGLKNELINLHSSMDSELLQLNNNVSNIYSNVSAKLEEEANLLSSADWEYGKIDVDARTAEVLCTIVPKVYTPDVTIATVLCGEQEFPMTYENGQYAASVPLPLFEESHITHVTLNDDGTIRTQALDWYISPRYEALPIVYAGYSSTGTGTTSSKGNVYAWSTAGTVDISIDYFGTFEVQSVEIVEILDGKEISRIPVDISEEGQMRYQETAMAADFAVPEYLAEGTITESGSILYDGNAHFFHFLDKDYRIPYGSMLEIYVDVVDGYGLRHRTVADCMAITENGEQDDARMEELRMYTYAESIAIYDADGTLLYTVDEDLFR